LDFARKANCDQGANVIFKELAGQDKRRKTQMK